MLKRFFEAGRKGLPMPSLPKRGTGTMVAIIGGACGATALVAFGTGWLVFRHSGEETARKSK